MQEKGVSWQGYGWKVLQLVHWSGLFLIILTSSACNNTMQSKLVNTAGEDLRGRVASIRTVTMYYINDTIDAAKSFGGYYFDTIDYKKNETRNYWVDNKSGAYDLMKYQKLGPFGIERKDYYHMFGDIKITKFYSYNANGKLMRLTSQDSLGKSIFNYKTNYDYDRKGRLSVMRIYGTDGFLRDSVIYEYNRDGSVCIESDYWMKDGSLQFRTVQYIGRGVDSTYDGNGVPDNVVTKDKKGRSETEEQFFNGKLFRGTRTFYDHHGQVVKVDENAGEGYITTTAFRNYYDKKGNWFRKDEYKYGKLHSRSIRRFIYDK